MDAKYIVPIVQNVGFPIAISIYLLIRMEKKIDEITNSIKELSNILKSR